MAMNTAFEVGGGWKEAVVGVHDLKFWISVAEHEFAWTLGHSGAVGRDQLEAWGLPDHASADEALFHCG